jgi:hypothetical protein
MDRVWLLRLILAVGTWFGGREEGPHLGWTGLSTVRLGEINLAAFRGLQLLGISINQKLATD